MSPARAIGRQAFRDGRLRTISFALLFGVVGLVQVVGYRHSYPTAADRLRFAESFGSNKAVRLFYGAPHDLLSVSGYVAWRVGGTVAIFAAVWGVLAASRALRAEEDSGRQELVLAAAVTRRAAMAASFAALAAGALLLFLGLTLGLALAGMPLAGSAFLGLAAVSPALVFTGIGALICQVMPTRRLATEAGCAAVVAFFALRILADTAAGLGWLRWATPLGWSEEMRAFTDPRPAVLLLPLAATAALLWAAARISLRRDVGAGLLAPRERSPARLGLLSSPTAEALRSERPSLIAWLTGTGLFAVLVGILSNSFNSSSISPSLRRQFAHLGTSIATPSGALGLYFLFFVLIVSLFACSQVASMRREEAEGRLETLLSLPIGRAAWLAGRLALALAGCAAVALVAALLSWAAASSQGVDVSLGQLLAAGANCLPAAILFLGLASLAFALAPRATAGIAYGLVTVAFLWELFGSLLGVPGWMLGASPFHQVGLLPAQSFRAGAAAAMVALAAICLAFAATVFSRRDLAGP